MARYQVKPREDGRGPYRWAHVVKSRNGDNLRRGSIHCQLGDDLNINEVSRLIGLCSAEGFELRRAL